MVRVPPSEAHDVGVLGSGPGAEALARRVAEARSAVGSRSDVIVGCVGHEREWQGLLEDYRRTAAADPPSTLLELSPIAASAQIALASMLADNGLTVIGGRLVPLADGRSALYVDDAASDHPALAALLPSLADEV